MSKNTNLLSGASVLYHSFGKKTFNGFKFNEGKFGFTFEIVSMNEENVIISVNKK